MHFFLKINKKKLHGIKKRLYIYTIVTTRSCDKTKKNQNKMKNSVKRQTRKIGVAGGFINQVMGNNTSIPKVGEGATILHYSDRDAYEVIEVSKDGNACVIREMDTKFVGSGYGDEKYTYHSNVNNHTRNIEWNEKKQCWGDVGTKVEIIKSLYKKYDKEFGVHAIDMILKDNGIESYQHLYENPKADNFYEQKKVIDGVTKEYKTFNKVSIIFGEMSKYRDPSF